jgi:hypothetical protein
MKKRFYWRSYVSFSLVLSFLVITVSGIILYLAPPGRIARWTAWVMLGFNRGQWEDLHTLFSYLFIILGFFHLLMFNWKLFFSYIRTRLEKRLNRKREMVFAFLTFAVIFGFTLAKLPPVYSVMDLGNTISAQWGIKRGQPPVPHAEEMTLKEFSRELLRTDAEKVIAKLRELGYTVNDSSQVFEDIANENDMPSSELFSALSEYFEVNILIRDRRGFTP